MATIIKTHTGVICECCLINYYNAEPCDCKDTDPSLRDHALLPWHFMDITIEEDTENVHFGYTCLGCADATLAGDRYDVQIHVWA